MGVLSDIHINPFYRDNITRLSYCEDNGVKTRYTDQLAPLGRMGCDPPVELLRRFLVKINETEPDLDFLFMPGDFIGHAIPMPNSSEPINPTKWAQLMDVHKQISNLIK